MRRTDYAGPAMVIDSDAALIARSVQDPAAFTEIFHRHWPAIHRFCTSRAGSPGEDLAAETFHVAFDQRARFDPRQSGAGPWLYGIATNLLRRFFRTTARGERAVARLDPDGMPDPSEDALGRVEAQRLGSDLAAALGALSAGDREALLLLAWAQLTYEEIATALDIPIGTVRSRIHRARTAMRAALSTTSKDPS